MLTFIASEGKQMKLWLQRQGIKRALRLISGILGILGIWPRATLMNYWGHLIQKRQMMGTQMPTGKNRLGFVMYIIMMYPSFLM